MKNYTIKNVEVIDDTVNTEVEFVMDDDAIIKTTVSHFMPENKQAIIDGIENRGASEQVKYNAKVKNADILSELTGVKEGSESVIDKKISKV